MDSDNLCLMANQIARNFAVQGEDQAIGATAQHILDFWDPRMKAAMLTVDCNALNPIARAAMDRLRKDSSSG